MNRGSKVKSLPAEPLFRPNSELARYVPPHHIMKGGRVSSAAFLRDPGEDHLSVNSVEIESLPFIAEYYRKDLQKDDEAVAVSSLKILDYNKGASKGGIAVIKSDQTWVFACQQSLLPAYKYRKTPLSDSHCGVEFVRAFQSEVAEKRFARKMALEPKGRKPHLF
jgi:hypothetical protein